MLKLAGDKLRCLRKVNYLTQEQLASILKVSKSQLAAIECGKRKDSLSVYKAAVKFFDVSYDYFFLNEYDCETNLYIDLVMLKMKHMDLSLQKLVLKIVEGIFDYQNEDKE